SSQAVSKAFRSSGISQTVTLILSHLLFLTEPKEGDNHLPPHPTIPICPQPDKNQLTGGRATGPDQREVDAASRTGVGHSRQHVASLAHPVASTRRARLSWQWASDTARRGDAPLEA